MAVDQIGTKGLVDCSVAAADIAPGTITNAKLAGSIANAKLSNSSITVNGTSISLGASSGVPPVQWQAKVTSDGSTVTTMVAGRGYFVDNSSAAGLVKLPASAARGDMVQIKDYAGNFGTNSLTIQRNSHNIQGEANDSTITTNRASVALVYIDSTKGWLYTNESNVGDLGPPFVDATGGTVTTSGDDRIHTFTGDGNFVVSNAGKSAGSNTVNYLVVAGGGSGGNFGGGGGAGGLRSNYPSPATGGLSVPVATYPITVGAGGASQTGPAYGRGNDGSNTIFSTITSEGGGGGGTYWPGPPTSGNNVGRDGGSGGGGGVIEQPRATSTVPGSAGSGNTPPVSPSQGNPGGIGTRRTGTGTNDYGGGGGGGGHNAAGSAGTANDGPSPAGPASGGAGGAGGAGSPNQVNGSNVTYAGGGGGTFGASGGAGGGGTGATNSSSGGTAGTANTGGGGGASRAGSQPSGAGGSGVVIIRYKIQ